jgi:CENP-W protein
MSHPYSKSALRKTVHDYSTESGTQLRLTAQAEPLLYLEYLLFMKRLSRACTEEADRAQSSVIEEHHVDAALEVCYAY